MKRELELETPRQTERRGGGGGVYYEVEWMKRGVEKKLKPTNREK